jgi:transcription elongation GreA/GreB family factor
LRDEPPAEATARRLEFPPGDEDEQRRQRAVVGQRLSELAARIASAQLVEPHRQAHDKVRFGATVTLRDAGGATPGVERRLQIVGVDEADPAAGTVAFTAPIARAILGCAVGDVAILETADGGQLEIVALDCDARPPRGHRLPRPHPFGRHLERRREVGTYLRRPSRVRGSHPRRGDRRALRLCERRNTPVAPAGESAR